MSYLTVPVDRWLPLLVEQVRDGTPPIIGVTLRDP